MFRKTVLGSVVLLPLTACFSPDAPGATGTEQGESEMGTSGTGTSTSGPTNSTTGAATMTSSSSSEATSSTPSETGASSGESGTGTRTGTGSETGGVPVTCGNGEPDEGETCDDGNEVNGDGCNNDCVESGSVVWSDTHGNATATALTIDEDGSILVVGNTRASESIYYGDWRRLYAANGDILSTGDTNDFDVARITADSQSYLIVYLADVGDPGLTASPERHEYFGIFGVARVSELFSAEWSGELQNNREIGQIHARSGGGFLLSGSVHNSGFGFEYEHDGFLAAYANGGSLEWERLDADDGGPRDCHPSAMLSNGSSVVACVRSDGTVTVQRHLQDGIPNVSNELGSANLPYDWRNYFGGFGSRRYPTMAAGSDGESALTVANHVFKIGANISEEWDVQLEVSGDELILASAFDGAGNLVVGGRRQSASGEAGFDGIVVKLDPDGALLWTHLIDGPDDDEVRALAVSTLDRIAFAASLGLDSDSPELEVGLLNP